MQDGKQFDFLVVGSGIAAQAVLSKLPSDASVGVIECGADHQARAQFTAKHSEVAVRETGYRVFGFGGTSVKWGGNLVPFTALELSHERWPIDYSELDEFLEPALRFLGFGDQATRIAKEWRRNYTNVGPGKTTVQSFYRLRNQGERAILPDLSKNLNQISWYEGIWCESVHQHQGFVRAKCLDHKGMELFIKARNVVVASGGLESLRIIGNSAVGNQGFRLGTRWSPHLTGVVGYVRARERLPFGHEVQGNLIRTRYLHVSSANEPGLSAWQVTFLSVRTSLLELPKLGFRALPILFHLLAGKVLGYQPYLISVGGDQEPSADSRVQIGEADAMTVRASMTRGDFKSLEQMLVMVKEHIGSKGNITYFRRPEKNFEGMSHHLGGAPISQDEETGIVNTNLRIHTLTNVYVCSSAVFPTFSSANPTLLLTQLALRLGTFLEGEFESSRTGRG